MRRNRNATLTVEADSRALARHARPVTDPTWAVTPARQSRYRSVTMTSPAPTSTIGGSVLANLSTAELYERAIRDAEGTLAADGPLVVRTGTHTGRSPKDKFIVREPWSQDKVWWGEVNHEISEEHYSLLRARLMG